MATTARPSAEGAKDQASQAKNEAEQKTQELGDKFEWLGRAGWLAKGVIYALIGLLFFQIAVQGSSGEEASQSGAIEQVAKTPFGMWLLFILGIGLALYAIWRLFTVFLPGDWTGRALLDRIGYAISAIVYSTLLVNVISILVNQRSSSGGGNSDRRVEEVVKTVMEMPAGRWLVGIAGAVLIGVAVAFAKKGWSREFREDLSYAGGMEGTAIDKLGLFGWIARGVSMGLIGIFLIQAAYRFDPDQAAGLDDSIRQVSTNPAGAVLAALVGIGFVAFGAFCVLSARHRLLRAPRND